MRARCPGPFPQRGGSVYASVMTRQCLHFKKRLDTNYLALRSTRIFLHRRHGIRLGARGAAHGPCDATRGPVRTAQRRGNPARPVSATHSILHSTCALGLQLSSTRNPAAGRRPAGPGRAVARSGAGAGTPLSAQSAALETGDSDRLAAGSDSD